MFQLKSTAIHDGVLDPKYGINTTDESMIEEGIPKISFPMEWAGAPEGTKAFAFRYMDYDNAEDEGVIWIHWLGVSTDPSLTALAEDGARTEKSLIHGHNSWALPYGPYETLSEAAKVGYGGPAPGRRHTYEMVLYALDTVPDVKDGFYYSDLRNQMKGHVLDKAVLTMYYGE